MSQTPKGSVINSNQRGSLNTQLQKPPNIIKEGLVTKQGGRIKTWKKRWCILTDIGLNYYKIPQTEFKGTLGPQKYNNLQGTIEINCIEGVEASQDPKLKKKFCFKVATAPRVFLICTSSTAEMESWIDAIKDLKAKTKAKSNEFLSRIRTSVSQKDTHIDYDSKSEEELQTMLGGINQDMNNEIKTFIETIEKEKDVILELLIEREITQLKQKYMVEKQEIMDEVSKR